MKKFFPLFGAVGVLAVVAVVYVVAINLTSGTNRADVGSCTRTGSTHVVTVRENAVSPQHTEAARCDQLRIVNEDNTPRLMAFGNHDHHQPYDGVTEELLKRGQSLTVTLDQTGTFLFHDHLHDEVEGTFTVTTPQ